MILMLFLVKVIICSAIFWWYYWLFLRNKRFHHYNRFYLLASAALSVTIPLIKLPVFFNYGSSSHQIAYRAIETFTANNLSRIAESSADMHGPQILTIQSGLFIVYLIGLMILTLSLAKSLFIIIRIAKKYPFEFLDDLKFYNTAEPNTPFSFFKSIFWNTKLKHTTAEGQQVLRHEIFHVRQLHSADVLFIEILSTLLWFNPFFHLIKKELKAIHEFLADQYAISDNDRYAYAEFLLTEIVQANKPSLYNYFFQNQIKRRIAMITKFNKTRYGYWSRIMVLPVLFVVFCAIALYAERPSRKAVASQTLTQKKLERPNARMAANDTVPDKSIKFDSIVERKLRLQQELNELENRILELKKTELMMQLDNLKKQNEIHKESTLHLQKQRALEFEKMAELQNKANKRQKEYRNELQLKQQEQRQLQLQKVQELKIDQMNKQHEQVNEARLKHLEQEQLQMQKIHERRLDLLKKDQERAKEADLKFRGKRELQLKKEYDQKMDEFEKRKENQKKLLLKHEEQRELQLKKMEDLELKMLKEKMSTENENRKEESLKYKRKDETKPGTFPKEKPRPSIKRKKELTLEDDSGQKK